VGVGGWNKIADNTALVGTVVDHAYAGSWLEGDDDWSITIKPAPGYERIAMSNEGGNVECEIRTPIDDENSERAQFGELMGQTVRAYGCWCHDVSHDDKTELHPLQLLIWDSGPTVGERKRVKVMVFSDHSPRFMIVPPRPSPLHRDGRTHATFGLQFPVAPHDDVSPVYSIASERNMTDARSFTIVGGEGAYTLRGDINSGHGDDAGYYRGHLDLDYNTSREPSYIGLLRTGRDAHRGYYSWDAKSFFDQLKARFAEGIPAIRLRGHVINGLRVWSGEFDRTGRGAYCSWYMSWDQFRAKYDEKWKTMNLVDVETHIDDGRRYWTALWHDRVASDGIAWGSLESVLGAGRRWGAPPITLKTWVEGGGRHWIGIFRSSGVPTEVRQALTWAELVALHSEPGRAIAHLEPYLESGNRRWLAIVEDRPNDVTLTWWPNHHLYRDEIQRLYDTYGLEAFNFAICRGWS
jgi:hypothetical protein